IEPASVAKRNTARPLCPALSLTTKSFRFGSLLNTWPVGAPDGMLTVTGTLVTVAAVAPDYSVVTSVPLSDTDHGEPGALFVPGDGDSPQALTRTGSVGGAGPGWLAAMLSWAYPRPEQAGAAAAPEAASVIARRAPAVTAAAAGQRRLPR